jgi:hypothetical protein
VGCFSSRYSRMKLRTGRCCLFVGFEFWTGGGLCIFGKAWEEAESEGARVRGERKWEECEGVMG